MNPLDQKVYEALTRIPKGKVTTYGQVAKACGIKNPRQVGRILHINPRPDLYPCHRVVRADGKLAVNFGFQGLSGHTQRLTAEGVEVHNGKVDLKKYLWKI